jgi:hypothetical protein
VHVVVFELFKFLVQQHHHYGGPANFYHASQGGERLEFRALIAPIAAGQPSGSSREYFS